MSSEKFLYMHAGGQWYDFDDSHVSPISEDRIKTSAAYVLFYRRVADRFPSLTYFFQVSMDLKRAANVGRH
ncbi:unnamed protein product [Thlaspi arvense]|uniref:USP domain-containing protein n=1 Tax=Thlaspi arvense TaxID=13288 RepID=A0AAU9SG76_THLAR|nr:unnamed protein product [Thlaspi arvense]